MRFLYVLTFWFLSCKAYCQFEKPFNLVASVNADFGLKGLANNEVGMGAGVEAFLFAKNKLQLLVEGGAERFIGDKLYVEDGRGRENKTAAIYSLKAGPQFFVSDRIALSATMGPAWHSIREVGFTTDIGFKYALAAYLGYQRRIVTKIFMANIRDNNLQIRYFGLQFGYRFL